MEQSDILSIFFTRLYEDELNAKILDDIEYDIDEYGILNYVANVIAVPYSSFIQYIINHPSADSIASRNVTQSSSFSACEKEMVVALLSEDNRGLTALEIGKLFPQYRRSEKDGALMKYGENQVKTAEQLGLTFQYFNKWYLNCIGYLYNQLDDSEKQSLLARNILRDPLYRQMILDIRYHDINIVSYMGCLKSNETKLRRYDSVKRLLEICLEECKKDNISTFDVIDYKPSLEEIVKQEKKLKQANKKATNKKEIKLPYPSSNYSMVADDSSTNLFTSDDSDEP